MNDCSFLQFSSGVCRLLLLLAVCNVPLRSPCAAAEEPPATVDFDKEHPARLAKGLELFDNGVREILRKRCLECHGGEATESKFDLSTRAGLLKGGKAGAAVKLGESQDSLLVKLVLQTQDPHMPFGEDKLPEAEISQLVAWIDHGAPYDGKLTADGLKGPDWTATVLEDSARKFWSFQPLDSGEPPAVANETWCKTPIDQYIVAKLEAAALAPNPEASRQQLIRRAYFDLLGLPPQPEDVEKFLADKSDQAYEHLLDRILASPHYGERWARHWLDLARFAESHGFEHDYDRPTAYHYRDFVIQALNQDLPYDTFVKWQLAGDEYAPDNRLALMATGFLAAGVHSTQITANEVEKHRYDEMDDMLATTGTAMLGLTIGCARCHDHKFDPIPQRDYYRMLSSFTTTIRSEVELDFDPAGYATAKAAFDQAHLPFVAAVEKFEQEQLPAKLAAWEATRSANPAGSLWIVQEPASLKSKGGATFKSLGDGSYLVEGTNATFDTYTIVTETSLQEIRAVRLEVLTDPSMVRNGPGRASNGNFDLTDFKITAAPAKGDAAPIAVKLRNPRVTFEQKGLPIAAAIDDNLKSGWAVDPEFGKDHAAAFEFETPVGFPMGTVLTFTLDFQGNGGHNIGRPRISLTDASAKLELKGDGFPQQILTILDTPVADRTNDQQSALLKWYRHLDPDWQKVSGAAEEHLKQAPQPRLSKVLISSEGLPPIRLHSQGADFFNETYFLRRGDTENKQGVADQGFLQVLMRTPEQSAAWKQVAPEGTRTSYRRRGLADWMTDTDQGAGHLLARVIVNRLWQHHLGRGIVSTPSDFGTRGAAPTHPELLDWLARDLIARNWSLKQLHKQIMLSATYRQSSAFVKEKAAQDPDNLLWWRQQPRRLEAEVIRDAVLAVSGTLDERMFGPGTLDEASQRRSIYFTVKRSKLLPMMQVFDAPDGLSGIGERPTTTIAPQALLFLNNPHVRGACKELAKRISAHASAEDIVGAAYLHALSRAPTDDERADGVAFLTAQTTAHEQAAQPDSRLLAIADYCQILLCLNEFIYIE